MKLGVVGTGMIAQIVVPHLDEWDCPVAAICGTPGTMEQVHDLASRCGGSAEPAEFSDYGEMLAAADIDTVYLAVPNHLHMSFALAALETGKNVIVEKPIASNYQEAARLAAEARKRNLLLFEAISTLHLPNFAKLKELLPRVGTIKVVSCNYSSYSSRYNAFREGTVLPAFDPSKSGGALMDLGLYNMQYLVGLFGAPKSVRYEANVERAIDTSGVTTLDYGDFKAVSVAAKDCSAPNMYVVQGTEGYLLQASPANRCGAVTLHLNDGTEEHFDEGPELQWESEFRAFAALIGADDHESCYRLLAHSVAVSKAMNDARLSAGVVFPCDGDVAGDLPQTLAALEEQEAVLRVGDSFGAQDALRLGSAVVELLGEYDREVALSIYRESDGAVLYQWMMDSKGARNVSYIERKRQAALACGHSSLWAWAAHEHDGSCSNLFEAPTVFCPTGGAFPLRTDDGSWVATLSLSGLHEGLDHELVVRALCSVLNKGYGVDVPVYPGVPA